MRPRLEWRRSITVAPGLIKCGLWWPDPQENAPADAVDPFITRLRVHPPPFTVCGAEWDGSLVFLTIEGTAIQTARPVIRRRRVAVAPADVAASPPSSAVVRSRKPRTINRPLARPPLDEDGYEPTPAFLCSCTLSGADIPKEARDLVRTVPFSEMYRPPSSKTWPLLRMRGFPY